MAEATWPSWTQFAVGDLVEVRIDDLWAAAEIAELQRLETTFSYCVWIVGSNVWLDLETDEPDDFRGILRRRSKLSIGSGHFFENHSATLQS